MDYTGAALVTLSLAGITTALVEAARVDFGAPVVTIAGAAGLAAEVKTLPPVSQPYH